MPADRTVNTEQLVYSLLQDLHTKHAEFQIDAFVLERNSHGTVYGMHRQCLRELDVRWRNLRLAAIEYDRMIHKIVHLQQAWHWTAYSRKMRDLEVAELVIQAERAEHQVREFAREFKHLLTRATQLKERVGDVSEERRIKEDRLIFYNMVKECIAIDIWAQGKVGAKGIEVFRSLPMDMREKMLAECENKTELREWMVNLEVKDVPPIIAEYPSLRESLQLLS